MIVFAGGLLGGLAGLFAWALCKAAALGDRQAAAAPVYSQERRNVGTCGSCGGAVMFGPEERLASCECGDCQIPRRFFEVAS